MFTYHMWCLNQFKRSVLLPTQYVESNFIWRDNLNKNDLCTFQDQTAIEYHFKIQELSENVNIRLVYF